MKRNFVLIVANDPLFFFQHLRFLFDRDTKDHILFVSAPSANIPILLGPGKSRISIPLKRNPSIIDIWSLVYFVLLRLYYRPRLCISFTPKGLLLNSLSSLFPGITVHYATGQRWATFVGIKRIFYRSLEALLFRLLDASYCDSFSQSFFLSRELNIEPPKVIGAGSVSGVDLIRFNPGLPSPTIEFSNFVFGYVGRVVRDKGIFDLIASFQMLQSQFPNIQLLLVGPNELIGSDREHFNNQISANPSITSQPFSSCVEDFYKQIDVFVLPSYREGFGTVLLEAAASKIPIIASSIVGPIDFVQDSITGLLFSPGDQKQLLNCMQKYLYDTDLRTRMADNAFATVSSSFSREFVASNFVNEFLM